MWNPELALQIMHMNAILCGWIPNKTPIDINMDCQVAYIDCLMEEANRPLPFEQRYKLCISKLENK